MKIGIRIDFMRYDYMRTAISFNLIKYVCQSNAHGVEISSIELTIFYFDEICVKMKVGLVQRTIMQRKTQNRL